MLGSSIKVGSIFEFAFFDEIFRHRKMSVTVSWHDEHNHEYLSKSRETIVKLSDAEEYDGKTAKLVLVYHKDLMDVDCKLEKPLTGEDYDLGVPIEQGAAVFRVRLNTLSMRHYKDCCFKFKIYIKESPDELFYSDKFKVYSKVNSRYRKLDNAFKRCDQGTKKRKCENDKDMDLQDLRQEVHNLKNQHANLTNQHIVDEMLHCLSLRRRYPVDAWLEHGFTSEHLIRAKFPEDIRNLYAELERMHPRLPSFTSGPNPLELSDLDPEKYHSGDKPRVRCPRCHANVLLKNDGTLQKHACRS